MLVKIQSLLSVRILMKSLNMLCRQNGELLISKANGRPTKRHGWADTVNNAEVSLQKNIVVNSQVCPVACSSSDLRLNF